MSIADRVRDQLTLLNAGQPLEALDRFFSDDCVLFDNDQLFARGKAACRAKQEPFITRARAIEGRITDCCLDEDTATCAFRNRTTFVDGSGERIEIDGLHVQRWAAGQVVEERYYRGELMVQKLGEGVLEAGEPLRLAK